MKEKPSNVEYINLQRK